MMDWITMWGTRMAVVFCLGLFPLTVMVKGGRAN